MNPVPNENPSVVLVHGAYADGSSWSEVIRRLQDAGVTTGLTRLSAGRGRG
jgi:hypothetical protein